LVPKVSERSEPLSVSEGIFNVPSNSKLAMLVRDQ
jgi:hypothetical protein